MGSIISINQEIKSKLLIMNPIEKRLLENEKNSLIELLNESNLSNKDKEIIKKIYESNPNLFRLYNSEIHEDNYFNSLFDLFLLLKIQNQKFNYPYLYWEFIEDQIKGNKFLQMRFQNLKIKESQNQF